MADEKRRIFFFQINQLNKVSNLALVHSQHMFEGLLVRVSSSE